LFVFGQMCLKQQCLDVSSISVPDCPDCSGQGVSYFTSLLARLCGYRYTFPVLMGRVGGGRFCRQGSGLRGLPMPC